MMICATPSQFFGSVKYSALSPSATEAITHRLPRFLREKCQGELVLLIFFYSIHRICEGKQPIGDLVGETWGNWGAWDKVDTKLCASNKFSFKIFVGAHSDPVLPENPSTNYHKLMFCNPKMLGFLHNFRFIPWMILWCHITPNR